MRLRALLGAALAALLPSVVSGQTTAFINARVWDGTGAPPIERATIVVTDGRIAAVGPADRVPVPRDATRIDAAGRTIIPGLINAHGHLAGTSGLQAGPEFSTRENLRRQLALYARYGITTVFSLGEDNDQAIPLGDESRAATLDRARAFVAGPVITATTPDEARAAVDALAAKKVDYAKIRVDDNLGTATPTPLPVAAAAIARAHERGLRLFTHVFYLDDAKALVAAGSDFIAHSVRDRDVDAAFIAALKRRDVCYAPTLTREISTFVYESTPAFFSDPFFLREADASVLAQLKEPARQTQMRGSKAAQGYKAGLAVAKRNLKALADQGVRIAMGTDTGPPARFQGYFEHLELEMMVEAGLTPMQALVAATGDAARCMRTDDRLGTLRPGRFADLLVLTANPLEDIRHTKTIEAVWIGGKRLR